MRSVLVAALFAVVPAHAGPPDLVPAPKVAPTAPEAPKTSVPDVAPAAPTAPKTTAPRVTAPNTALDPKGQLRTLPSVTLADVMSTIPSATAGGALSMDGGRAAGVVLEPPAHPDAQLWPYGIVMTPPEVRDRLLITPGTNMLSSELRRDTSWGKRLADAVVERASLLVGLMLPRSL
jgi:hypothetical protein